MANLWAIVCRINPLDKDACSKIDAELSVSLETFNDVTSVFYYLHNKHSNDLFVLTKKKINEIIYNHIEELTSKEIKLTMSDVYRFRPMADILTEDVRIKIMEAWIKSDGQSSFYLLDIIAYNNPVILSFFERCISNYSKSKTYLNTRAVTDVFNNMPIEFVPQACELLNASTPSIAAILLTRNDIEEKYTLNGLKSLSKLKTRRSVKKTIQLNMLKSLGPRGRLDAIAHLVTQSAVVLDPAPTIEELQEFLFPCVLKYNDEVSNIVKRYEEMIKIKKGGDLINDKCI